MQNFLKHKDVAPVVEEKKEVIEMKEDKNIVKLSTTCTNQEGKVVLQGVATVMPPR